MSLVQTAAEVVVVLIVTLLSWWYLFGRTDTGQLVDGLLALSEWMIDIFVCFPVGVWIGLREWIKGEDK